ncbi:MAG: ATP-binding protein [Candidatus Limnocylindrales bacterium]
MAEPTRSAWQGLQDRAGNVRVRTTVAAVGIVGVALIGAAIALVAILGETLTQNVEEAARSRAEEVAATLTDGVGRLGLIGTREDDEVIQVIGGDGALLGWSRNVAKRPPIAQLVPGGSARVHLPWDPGIDYIVTATAADLREGRSTVIVARALDDVADATRIVAGLLAVGLPVLLVLVAVTTWTVVGQALSPVEGIRREVEVISAEALHRRVPEPTGRDEIARLAATMNAMLGRLERSQARQRRFVSDASHELRSPIASIRQHAEVALAHPDRMTTGALAETVLAEDIRLQGLVDDLLLLARADEGTLVAAERAVDLDDVVFEEARRLAGATRLTVDQSAISAGRVRGDAAQLQRLTRNLLENALRHARSRVAVGVHEIDAFVVLRVDDDGAGVDPEDQTRIFERFIRLDDARGRDEGGSGLGLAIVAEIAAAHGGTVSVMNGPDGGARFEVRLPLLVDR